LPTFRKLKLGLRSCPFHDSVGEGCSDKEAAMSLADIREKYREKLEEHREKIRTMEETDARHFRQEGSGPLSDITAEIKAEYHRHIETYATLIAEIDAILGA
jgi:hypothetical protein